jgi:hypothetical protein
MDEPVRNPNAVVVVDIDPPSCPIPSAIHRPDGVYDRWQNDLVSLSGIRGAG